VTDYTPVSGLPFYLSGEAAMFANVTEGIRRVGFVALVLIVVGMFLWAVNTYIPMAQSIKDILNIVVVVAVCVFVLQAVGLWTPFVGFFGNLTARILPPQPRT
jgi:hypothetical protein